MIPFEAAWDTITKNDLRDFSRFSPEQQAALVAFQQNVDAAAVGEPDVEDVRDESSDDACCRSLKEAIAAIPIDTWGMHLLNEELTSPDKCIDGSCYESDDNCRSFAATVQIQLDIWDLDFKDRADYDSHFGANPNLKSRVAFANPPFADAGEYAYDSDKEQLRKDQVRQALLEYEACKAQAEFDFGEEEEAHPLFTASADPFEAGWDSIVKMPFVPGSVREMTAEDSERWGFPEGTEMTQPNNPERYLPRPKLIGDFINEETGKLLPIIIQQGLKANPEAVEREKGMRRVFGDGLRDSRTTTAHIPLDRLGMNPSTEMWFGGKQSDPHAVLNYNTIEQIYTPKNFRRQGMASAILDALVEAKRFGTKYHSGIYPTAMNEQGHTIHDMTPDDKLSYSRPYVDAETGMPYLQTYPHELNPVSGIATKDYIELMASRGLYPTIIQERDINYVPRGLLGMPTGEPLPKAGEPRAANPNNRWVDETAKENNLYFEANQWSRPGSREDDRRGGGWKLDEEQPFIRPTASTIINRAKREAYHRNKVMREQEAASDKCPQNGEPDPITGKVHPYLEDSDIKEPDGCDCWDDWRAARDAYFEEFPEHDWRLEYEEGEESDEVPNIGFHLSQFDKDFNELVSSGKLIPAPEPTWRLREGKDEYEPLYGGKTLNEWGRERK